MYKMPHRPLNVERMYDMKLRKAADTSSDDEVDPIAISHAVSRELAGTLEIDPREVRVVMQHVDAHRARGGQEADQ